MQGSWHLSSEHNFKPEFRPCPGAVALNTPITNTYFRHRGLLSCIYEDTSIYCIHSNIVLLRMYDKTPASARVRLVDPPYQSD